MALCEQPRILLRSNKQPGQSVVDRFQFDHLQLELRQMIGDLLDIQWRLEASVRFEAPPPCLQPAQLFTSPHPKPGIRLSDECVDRLLSLDHSPYPAAGMGHSPEPIQPHTQVAISTIEERLKAQLDIPAQIEIQIIDPHEVQELTQPCIPESRITTAASSTTSPRRSTVATVTRPSKLGIWCAD